MQALLLSIGDEPVAVGKSVEEKTRLHDEAIPLTIISAYTNCHKQVRPFGTGLYPLRLSGKRRDLT